MNFRWLRDLPPWQKTRAIFGSTFSAFLPVISAIFSATAALPGAHMLTATSGFPTTASAYPMQPAKPQAPQLAPGRVSRTCSTLGSTLTTNRAATDGQRHAKDDAEPREHDQRYVHRGHGNVSGSFRCAAGFDEREQACWQKLTARERTPVSGYALIVHTWSFTFRVFVTKPPIRCGTVHDCYFVHLPLVRIRTVLQRDHAGKSQECQGDQPGQNE